MKKLSLFKKLLVGALVFGVMAIGGCGSSKTSGDEMTTLEKAKEQGYVTVGFANEKPYAYKNADGELTGEAVEIARIILKELGISEMRGELTEFGSLIPGLQAKRFDMITAGMYITPERAKEVSFANPEYSIGEAIAVVKGNPLGLYSYEDIANSPTARVAIPAGVIEYDYLIAAGVPKDRILTVPDIPAAISAIQSGRADVYCGTSPTVNAALKTANDPNLEWVEDFKQPMIDGESVRGYGATAFRHEDVDFREAFNVELEKLKESGELLRILESFGFTEQDLPGDITAEELSK
ncbi:MAG: ectoine/hydroxyectoine ABC transporter substrate-binding protein EhuB [Desulfitobacterium sp.]|nr:ectoine/hydroxyectoine ABC transporter substrate-binding protein EhuB [Desulfitobacterium sp.]